MTTLRAVFRLGVVEVGPGFVAYRNRTASGRIRLNAEQEERWRAWFMRQRYAPVTVRPSARTCECGHPDREHRSTYSRSGNFKHRLCMVDGCDCIDFRFRAAKR